MEQEWTLAHLKPGESGVIEAIRGTGPIKRRLVDMGLTPGTPIFVRKVAPLGDPMECNVRGYELSLRISDAKNILIERDAAPGDGR